jgi:hypothetical protein
MVLHYQYALTMAAFDLPSYHNDVENELARVVAAKPGSTYEAFVRSNAEKLLGAIRAGDLTQAQRLVKHDQGYPDAA